MRRTQDFSIYTSADSHREDSRSKVVQPSGSPAGKGNTLISQTGDEKFGLTKDAGNLCIQLGAFGSGYIYIYHA